MWWCKRKLRIASDLVPLIQEKAKADNKSADIILDELLRNQLVKGVIYRCCNCHNALEVVCDEKLGYCMYCEIFTSTYVA